MFRVGEDQSRAQESQRARCRERDLRRRTQREQRSRPKHVSQHPDSAHGSAHDAEDLAGVLAAHGPAQCQQSQGGAQEGDRGLDRETARMRRARAGGVDREGLVYA